MHTQCESTEQNPEEENNLKLEGMKNGKHFIIHRIQS
jgi:hypothetical protein